MIVTWFDFFSGWVSGMAGLVAGHPIDTIKVVQQIHCIRVVDSIRHIYSETGVSSFFRGMSTPLITTGALNSIFFGVYANSLEILKWNKNYSSESNSPRLSYLDHFISGCIAGTAQLIPGCPIDVVKVQLQAKPRSVVAGPVECIKMILKNGGIQGLYRGIGSHAWRDIPSSGIYFLVYEFSKTNMSAVLNGGTKENYFVAGGLAGILSWWSSLPMDVVKSRLQADCPQTPQYKGVGHCISLIWKQEGLVGLFHGFWAISIRAFIVNGVIFLVYEHLSRNNVRVTL